MFVYSIKSKQIKAAFLVTFTILTVICLFVLARESEETGKDANINLKASTQEERVNFISQFGWEIDEEPVEVCEVIIPAEFDETYTSYNEIQKSQGFDLTAYAGKRAKRWTYCIKNYEDYENQDFIRVNILVYDGIVIGGDVCSLELDGFMHGFYKP